MLTTVPQNIPNNNFVVETSYNKKTINRIDLVKPQTEKLEIKNSATKSYDDFFTNEELKLPKLPKIQLPDRSIATDYSSDFYFATRMEQMSLEEAENIKLQVNKYPDIYPMPCMAITAEAIKNSIKELDKQFNLTSEEKQLFNEISLELKQLFPNYAYKKSLVVAYKFILYKSLLEHNFALDGYKPDKELTPDQLELDGPLSVVDAQVAHSKMCVYLQNVAGIQAISTFQPYCTLSKIKNLPWDQLLSKNDIFKKELFKIYFNVVYYRDLFGKFGAFNAFDALCSNEVLIPYTQELAINFFNKTWSLPLWLIGYVADQELVNADDYTMNSSSFFEHDLFHLAAKLYQSNNDADKNSIKHFFKIARLIYQNKNLITAANFKAIELCLFSMSHEQGLLSNKDGEFSKNIADVFQVTYSLSEYISIQGVPPDYKTNNEAIKTASYFLTQLTNSRLSEFQIVNFLAKNIVHKSLENPEATDSKEANNSFITINPGNIAFIEDMIQQIKHNKSIFQQYGLNSSRTIAILRLYYQKLVQLYREDKISLAELQQQRINDTVLLSARNNFDIEKKTILYFSQTDETLDNTMRWQIACEKIAKIIAEHQKVLETSKANNTINSSTYT